jgi:hypothetical protein
VAGQVALKAPELILFLSPLLTVLVNSSMRLFKVPWLLLDTGLSSRLSGVFTPDLLVKHHTLILRGCSIVANIPLRMVLVQMDTSIPYAVLPNKWLIPCPVESSSVNSSMDYPVPSVLAWYVKKVPLKMLFIMFFGPRLCTGKEFMTMRSSIFIRINSDLALIMVIQIQGMIVLAVILRIPTLTMIVITLIPVTAPGIENVPASVLIFERGRNSSAKSNTEHSASPGKFECYDCRGPHKHGDPVCSKYKKPTSSTKSPDCVHSLDRKSKTPPRAPSPHPNKFKIRNAHMEDLRKEQ